MKYINRSLEKEIILASKTFPAVLLTGPRRAGKTTLLKKLFPKASYYLLEDLDFISRVKSDPRAFIEEVKTPCILDEIQNIPELFNYIRTVIDTNPKRFGQWYFTGSQEAPLMVGVSESMAGRIAIFNLLPLSFKETNKISLFRGCFPEVIAHPKSAEIWFRSYIQTYLERDVRSLISIKDLATFRRFLTVLATRCGNVLNKTDIAAPLGVSVPTLTEWLNILEITGQIIIVPPFFENFGKRILKSPKIYFADSGLVSYILGMEKESMLLKSTFFGQIFEGFVASEIVKNQINEGKKKEIYYFRDQQGLEVDFVVPAGGDKLVIAEAKAVRSIKPDMGTTLNKLSNAVSSSYKLKKYIVHLNPPKTVKKDFRMVSPGIEAIPVSEISGLL